MLLPCKQPLHWGDRLSIQSHHSPWKVTYPSQIGCCFFFSPAIAYQISPMPVGGCRRLSTILRPEISGMLFGWGRTCVSIGQILQMFPNSQRCNPRTMTFSNEVVYKFLLAREREKVPSLISRLKRQAFSQSPCCSQPISAWHSVCSGRPLILYFLSCLMDSTW
jgi:hypothetical protein